MGFLFVKPIIFQTQIKIMSKLKIAVQKSGRLNEDSMILSVIN